MENIRLKCGCGNILEGNNASLCDSCAKERTNTYDVENVYLMRRAREELIDRFKNPNRRVESAPESQYDVLQTMPESETLDENGVEGNNFPYLVCGNVARRLDRQKDPYLNLLDPDNEIVVRKKKPIGLKTSGASYPFDDAYALHDYPNTRSHCCNSGVNVKLDLPKAGHGRGISYSVECSDSDLPLIFSERGFMAADPGERTRSMSFARRKHAPQESSFPRLCRDCGCEVTEHVNTSSTEKHLPPLDHTENRSRDRKWRTKDFERSEIRNRRMSRLDDNPHLPVSKRRELARKLADFRGAKIGELRRRMDDDRRRHKPRNYRNQDIGELRNGRVVKDRDAVQRQPWKSLYEDRMELENLKKKRRESRSSSDTPHGCKYKYRKSKEKTIQEIECDNTDYIHNKKKQEKLDRLILEREIQLREDEKRREEEEEKLRNARKEAEKRARMEQQKREDVERMLREKELQRREDEEREQEARRRQEEEEWRREERRREEEEKLRKAREEAEERARKEQQRRVNIERMLLEKELQRREDEERREEEEEKLRNARKEAEERAILEQQKRENMERMLLEKELQRREDEEREQEARKRKEEEERRREERRREEEEKLRVAREEAEQLAKEKHRLKDVEQLIQEEVTLRSWIEDSESETWSKLCLDTRQRGEEIRAREEVKREEEQRRQKGEDELRNARKEAEERARKEQQKREDMERMLREKELQHREKEKREQEARKKQEEMDALREQERRRKEEEKLRVAREEAEQLAQEKHRLKDVEQLIKEEATLRSWIEDSQSETWSKLCLDTRQRGEEICAREEAEKRSKEEQQKRDDMERMLAESEKQRREADEREQEARMAKGRGNMESPTSSTDESMRIKNRADILREDEEWLRKESEIRLKSRLLNAKDDKERARIQREEDERLQDDLAYLRFRHGQENGHLRRSANNLVLQDYYQAPRMSRRQQGNVRASNVIPGQLVVERDGKIRLVGDEIIEELEERIRQRRRSERLRAENSVSLDNRSTSWENNNQSRSRFFSNQDGLQSVSNHENEDRNEDGTHRVLGYQKPFFSTPFRSPSHSLADNGRSFSEPFSSSVEQESKKFQTPYLVNVGEGSLPLMKRGVSPLRVGKL